MSSSAGTWLVVNGGDVNLKGSNVGHQEGQSPPVEHLRGGDITGVHFGHNRVSHHGNSSRNRSGEKKNSETNLYLYDFIKQGLWILLKFKLEELQEERRGEEAVLCFTVLNSILLYCILLYFPVLSCVPLYCTLLCFPP